MIKSKVNKILESMLKDIITNKTVHRIEYMIKKFEQSETTPSYLRCDSLTLLLIHPAEDPLPI